MEHQLDPWVVEMTQSHLPAVERYVRSMIRDQDEAADICQEVALRLLLAARVGEVPESPAPWMYRVAHNLVVSRARHHAIVQKAAGRLVDRGTVRAVDEDVLAREQHQSLASSLASVQPDHRQAMVLAANGHPMREIAAQIGRTELATRAMLCRARARLRSEMIAADVL